jgi:hypothetical protein
MSNFIIHQNEASFSIEFPAGIHIPSVTAVCKKCNCQIFATCPADVEDMMINHFIQLHSQYLNKYLMYYTQSNNPVYQPQSNPPMVSSTTNSVPFPQYSYTEDTYKNAVDGVVAEVQELKEELKDMIDRMKVLIEAIEIKYITEGD